jgi:hypothetical protein
MAMDEPGNMKDEKPAENLRQDYSGRENDGLAALDPRHLAGRDAAPPRLPWISVKEKPLDRLELGPFRTAPFFAALQSPEGAYSYIAAQLEWSSVGGLQLIVQGTGEPIAMDWKHVTHYMLISKPGQ